MLGALLGGGQGSTAQIIGAVGGFGLNATFLKFGRDAEKQADLMGAQILARAGYDPMAMVSFFDELREMQGRDPSKLETFFSSHPAPVDRAQYVGQETNSLRVRPDRPTGDFRRIRRLLNRLPEAPSMQQLASGSPPASAPSDDQRRGEEVRRSRVSIERPSSRMVGYEARDNLYRIWYPANWEAMEGSEGPGVTILPEGGVVDAGGRPNIVYGVIVNRFQPKSQRSSKFSGPFSNRSTLGRAANELIDSLLQGNTYLAVVPNSTRGETIDGKRGVSVMLEGRSSATGDDELVSVWTRPLGNGDLLYFLFITPEYDRNLLQPVFEEMIASVTVETR
jgi:hypothetical protein